MTSFIVLIFTTFLHWQGESIPKYPVDILFKYNFATTVSQSEDIQPFLPRLAKHCSRFICNEETDDSQYLIITNL